MGVEQENREVWGRQILLRRIVSLLTQNVCQSYNKEPTRFTVNSSLISQSQDFKNCKFHYFRYLNQSCHSFVIVGGPRPKEDWGGCSLSPLFLHCCWQQCCFQNWLIGEWWLLTRSSALKAELQQAVAVKKGHCHPYFCTGVGGTLPSELDV